ncbi:hypothetical protein ABT301_29705 [Streptomyces sp. NPDC000987]|uniref:hypothetical protein n=1 Tax=Streptomyces sp. NPDC000987 TaxID=3154374 RepID=UPI0033348FB4
MNRSRSRSIQAGIFALGISAASIMLTASPASAHYVYEGGWTYRTDYDCTANRSETSHGRYGDGYSRSDVAAWEASPIGQCTYLSWRPAGYIATKLVLYKWNSTKKKWAACYKSKWYYNTKNKHKIDLRVTYKNGGRGACGPGWYNTLAIGVQKNGDWHGGGIWSGNHYLPV